VTVAESWTCPTCGSATPARYCAQCGESRHDPRELTLRGLLLQLFQSVTSLDGKVLRSLRCLVTRPGALSTAFVRGQRLSYVGPIPLFLLANVAFFGFESLTHLHILSSTLASHMHDQDWSALAQRLVQRRLERLGATLEDFAALFDRAVVLHAKSLVVLMVVPFALLLPLVVRQRRPFAAHAVFALHLFAFLLLLLCAVLAVGALAARFGGSGLDSKPVDLVLSVLYLLACARYLYIALGAFYGSTGLARAFQTAVLSASVAAIVLGYRFTLFLITLYTT